MKTKSSYYDNPSHRLGSDKCERCFVFILSPAVETLILLAQIMYTKRTKHFFFFLVFSDKLAKFDSAWRERERCSVSSHDS